MNNQRECKSVNVPQVDNTPLVCNEQISSECILHGDAIPYLRLPENSNEKVIINTLLTSLIDARNRILSLEARVTQLEEN